MWHMTAKTFCHLICIPSSPTVFLFIQWMQPLWRFSSLAQEPRCSSHPSMSCKHREYVSLHLDWLSHNRDVVISLPFLFCHIPMLIKMERQTRSHGRLHVKYNYVSGRSKNPSKTNLMRRLMVSKMVDSGTWTARDVDEIIPFLTLILAHSCGISN